MDEAANRNEMRMSFLTVEATTADVIDGFEIRAWIDELRAEAPVPFGVGASGTGKRLRRPT